MIEGRKRLVGWSLQKGESEFDTPDQRVYVLLNVADLVIDFLANVFFGWVPERGWVRALVVVIYLALAAAGIYLAATGFSP